MHYPYGGSTIERTMLCPGSQAAIALLPERPAGEAAERGTRIHGWMERALKNDTTKPKKRLTKKDKEEGLIGAQSAMVIKEVAIKYGFAPSELVIEETLGAKTVHEKAGGTPDVYAFKTFGDLLVIDLKTGNTLVDAQDNKQLLFYAVAVLSNLDEFTRASLNNVHLVIVQPEQQAPYTCHISEWSISVGELSVYETLFKEAVEYAEAHPEERRPGNHCMDKYCDARTSCPAYQNHVNSLAAGALFLACNGTAPAVPTTAAGLAQILSAKDKLLDLIKQAEADAKEALKSHPDSIPGWTLADTYSNRAWEDEAVTIDMARRYGLSEDEFQPRSLVSPAQFEKLLKLKNLDTDVPPTTRENTGVKLVKATKQNAFAAFAPNEAAAP